MADRTVRAIFEARVSGAQKGMRDLSKDVDGTGRKVDGLTKNLKGLDAVKVNPKIDLAIEAAQKRIKDLTLELGDLRTMEVTPEVTADIKAAKKRLAEARAELRDLNGAKAEMKVTADTVPAKKEIDKLADDVGEAGAEGGDEAGQGIVGGILDALRTIPIAGAIVGVGVAIAGGILLGIKDGLQIEAERDLFSAQTGLDEDTAARFGRAAGEAYANAWGDSVAANLDTARSAMAAGLIDDKATDEQIQNVIAKLQGLSDLFDYDIASSVRGVGNLMKTGLVRSADQAFDLITLASQKLPSDDLMDTLNEYSNQFVTLGIKGPEAFGLLVQAAKAGARDTDNVADTFKEMGLRIREGTKPATDALKALGLRPKEIVRAFQEGGPDAAEAIQVVFDALRKLEEKGGNTQAVVTNLFGGPGEDLGAALYALDIDKATKALEGTEGAAGAADRALSTMSDNTAAKMESAKRNVEVAMDGIKGALAEAFSDEISGAADWVSRNRAPLMEFFLGVIHGTLDMALTFAEFGATALSTISDLAEGLASFIASIPGVDDSLSTALYNVAISSEMAAMDIRRDVPGALDEVRDKVDTWAAPELLKARIHDATVAMTGDLEGFVDKVGEKDLSVTINGDTVNAEEALAELIDNIDAEDGTVLINGDKVPAEDALETLLRHIEAGGANVTVGADSAPAERRLRTFEGQVSAAEASMTVHADLTPAERELRDFKARLKKLGIRVSGVTSEGGVHEGGWISKGLHSGGRVPGIDPGYDNVLWPLNSGGRTLAQPLAGGEYVVNSRDSAYWAPVLEWMNNGGRPSVHNESHEMPVYIQNFNTNDAGSFRRAMPAEVAWRKGLKGEL